MTVELAGVPAAMPVTVVATTPSALADTLPKALALAVLFFTDTALLSTASVLKYDAASVRLAVTVDALLSC